MNILLWVLQALLALAFFAHGWIMVVPPASLIEQMNAAMAPGFRLFIGVAELIAAFGLIVPGATRIQPWWVPSAAAGLMVVMISATIFHVMRGEVSSAITTVVLLVICTFVAYMRWKVMPIPARSTSGAVVTRA